MASFPKSTKQPIAVTHWSDLDLSCQHITTGNFMEFNVAKAMELCPRQSVNIDMRTFARLAPMPIPTYGNADIKNRAYFVPFRTVMKGWNEFIDDTTVVDANGDAIIPVVPRLDALEVLKMFVHPLFSTLYESGDVGYEDAKADFIYLGSTYDYEPVKGVFTPLGKHAYKLICSLGYRICFDERSCASFTMSALPLMCLVRVYFDWYFPSAYVDDDRANSVRRLLNMLPSDNPADSMRYFDAQYLAELFEQLYRVSYDSDYFVSAWDNPVAPNSGSYSDVAIPDATDGNLSESITTDPNGTPKIGWAFNVTQYAVDALKSVSDYMRRHQIAGARVLDRYLSRWGVRLPDASLDRSVFIGESISKVRFGDVTSTSDSYNDVSNSGSVLGGYAGKGIGDNDAKSFVSYSTDEFGMLIIISTVVPKTAYYQGMDRSTFHLSRFDFYTPEFDNLGTQALATRELFVPVTDYMQVDQTDGIDYDSAVFGFTPRFAEYKKGYDNMTGDLVLGSKNTGLEGWTLMRDVSSYYDSRAFSRYADVVHDQNFVEGVDANQYNRIFYVTDDQEDKFYIIHNFVIKSRFPGKALYDSYEFKDYDKAEKVHIDVNGVRAN